jgi:hypothetical protein
VDTTHRIRTVAILRRTTQPLLSSTLLHRLSLHGAVHPAIVV